jgi:hypothetical protein
MGMFDWYEPRPSLSCPACGVHLYEWQGKDGPCGLFVWQQGTLVPVDQRVDDDLRLPQDKLLEVRLPEEFIIYSYDCPKHGPIDALCKTENGAWSATEIEAVNARKS